jgi:adenylosuccinate lyase
VAAVKAGTGREAAHEVIKEHAVAVALSLREKGAEGNDLVERLAADERFPLGEGELRALLTEPLDFVGDARRQVRAVVERVDAVVATNPAAAGYVPEPIL